MSDSLSMEWNRRLRGLTMFVFNFGVESLEQSVKRTSVQKSNKNEIFTARAKNLNCLRNDFGSNSRNL